MSYILEDIQIKLCIWDFYGQKSYLNCCHNFLSIKISYMSNYFLLQNYDIMEQKVLQGILEFFCMIENDLVLKNIQSCMHQICIIFDIENLLFYSISFRNCLQCKSADNNDELSRTIKLYFNILELFIRLVVACAI